MAEHRQLKNPPLVEALFEIRWTLGQVAPDVFHDPGFGVAHVRFYDLVKHTFPFIEPLPSLQVPNELTPYIPKYRYRVDGNKWPLVQIGPGVASLNFTKPYTWRSFLEYAKKLIPNVLEAYKGHDLVFSSIMLRYINAEPFDYERADLLGFIEKNLHTTFYSPVKSGSLHAKSVEAVNWITQYKLTKPKGMGILRFSTGISGEEIKSILWEQVVQAIGDQVPQPDNDKNSEIIQWLKSAHNVVEDWFFSIVGEALLKKYEEDIQ